MPVDPADVVLSVTDAAQIVGPGQQVNVSIDVANLAPDIPADEPRICDGPWPGATGLAASATVTVGAGNTVVDHPLCLLPDRTESVDLTFQAPEQVGEYAVAYSIKNQQGDPPQLYDAYAHDLVVKEGGDPGGGGSSLTAKNVVLGGLAAGALLYADGTLR